MTCVTHNKELDVFQISDPYKWCESQLELKFVTGEFIYNKDGQVVFYHPILFLSLAAWIGEECEINVFFAIHMYNAVGSTNRKNVQSFNLKRLTKIQVSVDDQFVFGSKINYDNMEFYVYMNNINMKAFTL